MFEMPDADFNMDLLPEMPPAASPEQFGQPQNNGDEPLEEMGLQEAEIAAGGGTLTGDVTSPQVLQEWFQDVWAIYFLHCPVQHCCLHPTRSSTIVQPAPMGQWQPLANSSHQ